MKRVSFRSETESFVTNCKSVSAGERALQGGREEIQSLEKNIKNSAQEIIF